jgi:hypothetical protein
MSLADTVMSNASLGIRLAAAGKILFPILVVWAVYAWSLSQLRKGYNDLKCTRTNLEVINTFRGQARSTQSFLKADVKQIKFGALSTFSTRPLMGLVFTAGNKQVKILEGLKCVEAQKILDQLQHLGYDIVRDVAMPMMVEMEEEHRKSWLNLQ